MEENIETRVPPQDLDAEQCVLGCMLFSNDGKKTAAAKMEASDFYSKKNQKIFELILSFPLDTKVDIVLINDALRKEWIADLIPPTYIMTLLQLVPTAANIEKYIEIVKRKSQYRKHILELKQAQEMCYDESDIQEVNNTLLKTITETVQANDDVCTYSPESSIEKNMAEILKEKRTGIVKTGLDSINEQLPNYGFKKGHLYFIVARPRVGKSGLAQFMAEKIAQEQQLPVLFFQLEMSKSDMYDRGRASRMGIPYVELARTPQKYSDAMWQASIEMMQIPFYIDDTASLDASTIAARTFRAKAIGRCSIVFIDHLHRMRHHLKKGQNMVDAIGHSCRMLKTLAKEADIPVVALAQLHRESEKRNGRISYVRPILTDIRSCGEIEQEADYVAGLYRPYIAKQEEEIKNVIEWIVLKSRGGFENITPIGCDMATNRFWNLSDEEVVRYHKKMFEKKKRAKNDDSETVERERKDID